MNKKLKIAILLIIVLFLFKSCIYDNRIVGTVVKGEGYSEYNGNDYKEDTYEYDSSDKVILGKSSTGGMIYGLKSDPDRNYLILEYFIDSVQFTKVGYTPVKNSEVTAVFLESTMKEKKEDIDSLKKLEKITGEEYKFMVNDESYRFLTPVYLGYNGIKVGERHIGDVGFINGKWVFVKKRYVHKDHSYENDKYKDEMGIDDEWEYYDKRGYAFVYQGVVIEDKEIIEILESTLK